MAGKENREATDEPEKRIPMLTIGRRGRETRQNLEVEERGNADGGPLRGEWREEARGREHNARERDGQTVDRSQPTRSCVADEHISRCDLRHD